MLGLSEKEKAQILSINLANDPARLYKEVWIGLGGVQSAVYATEVSAEEYLTFTTRSARRWRSSPWPKSWGAIWRPPSGNWPNKGAKDNGRPGSWSPGVGFCLRLPVAALSRTPHGGSPALGPSREPAPHGVPVRGLGGGAAPRTARHSPHRRASHPDFLFPEGDTSRTGTASRRPLPPLRARQKPHGTVALRGRTHAAARPGNTYRRIGPPQKKKSNLKHSTTMRTKNVGNEEIGGIVARRKREHAENGRLLAALERMQAEALLSVFCGSWIATEGTTSLLVRREAEATACCCATTRTATRASSRTCAPRDADDACC